MFAIINSATRNNLLLSHLCSVGGISSGQISRSGIAGSKAGAQVVLSGIVTFPCLGCDYHHNPLFIRNLYVQTTLFVYFWFLSL